MPLVWIGNNAPMESGVAIPGPRITFAAVPDEDTADEHFKAITARVVDGDHMDGVFATHSASDAPAWVESNDKAFAKKISAHYGCPVGRPKNWEG